MDVRQITRNKKQFLDLLLLADPSEEMIGKYLDEGKMFVAFENEIAVCEAVVDDKGEIKNLAVLPAYQGKGYGKKMLDWLSVYYTGSFIALLVGTSDQGVGFYERCGFCYDYKLEGFFIKNYPEPIYENGRLCVDMICLKRVLLQPELRIQEESDADFSEITAVWEASVRATHHFLREEDIIFYKSMFLNGKIRPKHLICVRNESHTLLAFMGISGKEIEMLFLHPGCRAQGLGKRQVLHAINEYGVNRVDVNEQNDQAVGFYQKMGFIVEKRDAADGMGKPYPILHLKLKEES